MQKTIPLEPGVCYHIYNRGINGENIFREERNYAHLLNLYARHIEPVAETFAYCLLSNHFHLLVRIKETFEVLETSKVYLQFSNFFNACKSVNKAYQRTGSLFEHRFGRIPVLSDRYFVRLVHYIHWNPQKHGFVADWREWPYSSYHALLSDKPTRLQRDEVLGWFNGRAAFVHVHQAPSDETEIQGLVGADEQTA